MPSLGSLLIGAAIISLIILLVALVARKSANFHGDQAEYESEQRQESEMLEDRDDLK